MKEQLEKLSKNQAQHMIQMLVTTGAIPEEAALKCIQLTLETVEDSDEIIDESGQKFHCIHDYRIQEFNHSIWSLKHKVKMLNNEICRVEKKLKGYNEEE